VGVRVPPLELDLLRKGKPNGDGTRFEIEGATSLEGSTPSSSASLQIRSDQSMCPWPSGQAPVFQTGQAGSTPAGHSREWANGRLPDFESGGGGSNPPSRTLTQLRPSNGE